MNRLTQWHKRRSLNRITEKLAAIAVLVPYWAAKRTKDNMVPREVVDKVANLIERRAILTVRRDRLTAELELAG